MPVQRRCESTAVQGGRGKGSSGLGPEARPEAARLAALLQVLWLDQEDAQAVAEGEEVTLMDWGNAIIRVRPAPSPKP